TFLGVYFPAIASLLTTRVSDENRSFVNGLIHAGPQLGSVLTGLLGYTFLFSHGWEYMFLLIGVSGIGWGLLLRWLSRRHTSKMHYQLLDSSPKQELSNNGTSSGSSKTINVSYSQRKEPPTCVDMPWRSLIRQGPVLAMFYASFCEGFFFHLLFSWLPTFFHDNFQDRKHSAWMYNVYPWIAKGISATLGGWISNRLIQQGTSITTTRKLMERLSLAGSSLCLFSLAIACQSGPLADFNVCLGLVVAAMFFQGFEISGVTINPIDLAPSYSGLLYGFMNGFAAIPGVFGVSLVGHLLHSYNNWSYVFLMISAVSFSGCIIYSLFASGKRLPHIDHS
ncbi:PREDICTED: solute carrier family 17 member 9-like, partial [Amphimedon queenslandica]|uniref:Major facilitator superfamily (MFS) profile domain-containing protein n=2 Tax=Amphimedon queenslandica TaxID=400682 RepID=A0AAN0JTM4_AMPQE